MSRKTLCEVVLVILLLAGCSHNKQAIVNDPTTEGKTVHQNAVPGNDSPDGNKSTAPQKPEIVKETNLQGIETALPDDSAVKELPDGLQDVYFVFDSYALDGSANAIIKRLAALIAKDRTTQLIIEGHCDERGTVEYNLGLGDRRANVVREYLSALGIASKKIETLSYGKEKPVCAEESEECWGRNRRVHFVIRNIDK